MKKKRIGYSTIVKRNLKYSNIDGSAYAASSGFSNSYLNPYAIALGASNEQIGLLTAIPNLLGRISELSSSPIIEYFKERKKTIKLFKILQMLMWVPVFFVFLAPQHAIWLLILFFTIETISSSIITPIWDSLMGDVVPDEIKGRYFGGRNRITDFSHLVSILIAGLLLQYFANFNLVYGFGLIFFVSIIGKLISLIYVNKMYEPEYSTYKESEFSFKDFIKRMNRTNYGIFVIYLSLLMFSVHIAAPFFTVYMLRDLQFNYLTFTIVIAISIVARIVSGPIWGRHSDRFGNFTVIALTGLLVSFIPLFWLLSTNIIYLIIVELFSGFVWSGFDLASFNFVFDTVVPEKRVRAISYYHVLVGIGVFLGATLGGYLIKFGTMFWSSIYLVFIISGVLRFLVSAIFLPKIREVKKVRKISKGKLLWSVISSEITLGLTYPRILFRKRPRIPKKTLEKLIDEVKRFLERTFKE